MPMSPFSPQRAASEHLTLHCHYLTQSSTIITVNFGVQPLSAVPQISYSIFSCTPFHVGTQMFNRSRGWCVHNYIGFGL